MARGIDEFARVRDDALRGNADELRALSDEDVDPAIRPWLAHVRWMVLERDGPAPIDAPGEGLRHDQITTAMIQLDAVGLDALAVTVEPTSLVFLRATAIARLLRGDASALPELGERGAQLGHPESVLEAAILSAWAASDPARARRAFHMARAEARVTHEYLAGFVLARVRRLQGRGFVAARIVSALEPVVPVIWSRWIEWEGAFAGLSSGPVAVAIARAFAAVRSGRAGGLEEVRVQLEGLARCHAMVEDARLLVSSLDPVTGAAPDAPPQWLVELEPSNGARAYVVIEPGRLPRWHLATSLGSADIPRLEAAGPGAVRMHDLLTVLARHPQASVPRSEVFLAVYGFPFVPQKHDGALRVLLHRARSAVEGVAAIERDGDHLRLVVERRFAIEDGRARPDLDTRVLGLLARGVQARVEIASTLGVTVRAVADALRRLVEHGLCDKLERRGHYTLEDTTFRVPTAARVQLRRKGS